MVKNLAQAVGRRKTAVARVYLRNGDGKISVNGRDLPDFFPGETLCNEVKLPLAVTGSDGKFDILINVRGGGFNGQVGACVHGLARALADFDINNRSSLKENGFLTRDSRMVERKKYGQRGARRRFQFSKR